jgi:hypothetical protein
MELTDDRDFNVWDVMEEWAWSLSADQREAYLLACWELVEPHIGHHRLDLIYGNLCSRRDVEPHQICGIEPSDEPAVFDDADAERWPVFWLTHFGEHLAAESCECDRRISPNPDEDQAWWEDGERGERILMDTLTCLVVAAGGTPTGAAVFRSMMEEWDGDFAGLVVSSTQAAYSPAVGGRERS